MSDNKDDKTAQDEQATDSVSITKADLEASNEALLKGVGDTLKEGLAQIAEALTKKEEPKEQEPKTESVTKGAGEQEKTESSDTPSAEQSAIVKGFEALSGTLTALAEKLEKTQAEKTEPKTEDGKVEKSEGSEDPAKGKDELMTEALLKATEMMDDITNGRLSGPNSQNESVQKSSISKQDKISGFFEKK